MGELKLFAPALAEFGIGDVHDLCDATLISDAELMDAVGMKKVSARAWREA